MKLIYPVMITPAGESEFFVEIPDMDIATQGTSLENAIDMARDAISLMAVDIASRSRKNYRPEAGRKKHSHPCGRRHQRIPPYAGQPGCAEKLHDPLVAERKSGGGKYKFLRCSSGSIKTAAANKLKSPLDICA